MLFWGNIINGVKSLATSISASWPVASPATVQDRRSCWSLLHVPSMRIWNGSAQVVLVLQRLIATHRDSVDHKLYTTLFNHSITWKYYHDFWFEAPITIIYFTIANSKRRWKRYSGKLIFVCLIYREFNYHISKYLRVTNYKRTNAFTDSNSDAVFVETQLLLQWYKMMMIHLLFQPKAFLW